MRRLGITTILVGLLVTLFAGLSFVKRDQVIDRVSLQKSKDTRKELPWLTAIGFGAMAVGVALYLIGKQHSENRFKGK